MMRSGVLKFQRGRKPDELDCTKLDKLRKALIITPANAGSATGCLAGKHEPDAQPRRTRIALPARLRFRTRMAAFSWFAWQRPLSSLARQASVEVALQSMSAFVRVMIKAASQDQTNF